MTTPQINATGVYTVREPFTIANGIIYRCEGIIGFNALDNHGINVFDEYYEPNNLTMSEYVADKDADVNIITLISTNGGPKLNIPDSYILTVPSVEIVPYARLILSVDLGLLPEDISLQSTIDEIKAVASDLIGVLPKVKAHRVSVEGGVDHDKHELLETNRRLAMRYRATAHAETRRLADVVASKDQYISLMEDVLVGINNLP